MIPRGARAAALLGQLGAEVAHSVHVCRLAVELFDQLQPLHQLNGRSRDWLAAAALLHDIGWTVSEAKHHKHTADLIRAHEADLPGFSATEVELIANIARYHRKAFPKLEHAPFAALLPAEREAVRKLAAILRIADGLDRPHRQAVTKLACTVTPTGVRIQIAARADAGAHLEGAARKADLFAEVFGSPAEFASS
jgi:exopolyphosphatase/guanosine-5'-triphosphate,3'-diphosphate pyrophosphatase